MPFEWIAAVRFLKDGRLQTIAILGGVAIGVGVIVFMAAILAGLEQNFLRRVLGAQAHVQVVAPDRVSRRLRGGEGEIDDPVVQRPTQRTVALDQWHAIGEDARALPGVTVVAPATTGSALAVRGDASRAVTLTGVTPDTYFRVVRVPDYIAAGEARLTSEDILVGLELARDLGAGVGDKLTIRAASGSSRTLTVAGLLDLGNKAANERITFVALRTAQSVLGLVGAVTSLDVNVDEPYDAERVAGILQSANHVQADSWIRTNAQFFTAINAQKATNRLIRVFVGLSTAFGVAAVLIVSVTQRSRDIGILRAMGARRGQILRAFLIQGGLLGFGGSVAGSALGATALMQWHELTRQADGSELFPLVLDLRLFISTAVGATLVGVAAAVVPALRAALLDPVVAIRG